jgi:hypothetical protein
LVQEVLTETVIEIAHSEVGGEVTGVLDAVTKSDHTTKPILMKLWLIKELL